ncbi:RagB/SusD family nutrient uptake outer membrane protein [Sphingobacterium sp. LRF_L2]|uniref:RagB/SusD family nutrient uptake outer membrane protein n=1 Tax=Sphingobacterium sp. LRF_L2 TaxID=3369421 RepID=UPI003F640AAF
MAGLLLASGCSTEDGLNLVPTTQISDENVFDTADRIEGLANGVYKSLKSASLYGGRYLLYQDVRGEDFLNITANSYTAYESWNNSYSSGSNDVNNLWSAAYATINRANILIDGLNTGKGDGKITEEKKQNYIAEAKFLRALSYFSLVNVFAQPYVKNGGLSPGLPLRLQAETDANNNDLARSTVSEVYAQILTDLDDAETGLPETYSTDLLNTTRAHKNTARALKTRVYLTIGELDSVIEEAVKLIPQNVAPFSAEQGVNHALQASILTIFGTSYVTKESILSMPMTTNDALSGQSSIGYIYNVNREYYLNPNGILNDAQWGADDVRRSLLYTNSGKQFLKKYAKASPFVDYIPVIRYAEVLLNYAEALATGGRNLSLAANLLEAVHQRSDPNYSFAASITGNESNLLEAIAKERRIELLGEGFRGFDLLRKLQDLPAKGDSNIQTSSVSVNAENYIFPSPSTELTTNKLFN